MSLSTRCPATAGRRASTTRAFTLVELLVVIGIIALLISILMPALTRARKSAQALLCASNMRQVGQAMFLYTNENKGMLPLGSLSLATDGKVAVWDSLISKNLGRESQSQYVNNNPPPTLKCPLDNVERPSYAPRAIRSYSMVQAATGTWPQRIPNGVAAESAYPKGHASYNVHFRAFKMTDIRRSSRTLLLVEAFGPTTTPNIAGHATGATCQIPNAQLGNYREPVHAKRWNYLMADGHVETLAPRDTVDTNAGLSTAPPGGMWMREQQ